MSQNSEIRIPFPGRELPALWTVPEAPRGVVLFAHGSGSGRRSPRNQLVAQVLGEDGFATLLADLLDEHEAQDRRKTFDIELLGERVLELIAWTGKQPAVRNVPLGLFGASTGSAAALWAAAAERRVQAVVSRGGRPDLARGVLPRVTAPTLFIVGSEDREVLELNREAMRHLGGEHKLHIVPGATHLFEEPGALRQAAFLASSWFLRHLAPPEDEATPCMFANRVDAGRRLAERLRGRPFVNPLVLAIPRGGVILGAEIARDLDADLDVILARKVGMPGNPEFALGAVAESGDVHYNVPLSEMSPAIRAFFDQEVLRQRVEIARRRTQFRRGRAPAPIEGRSVIVVDDGIATGSTMIASLHAVRLQKPQELVVAVPVAEPRRLRQVVDECDEAVCLIEAPNLLAVGQFYADFGQVEDEEVVATLRQFVRGHPVVFKGK